MRFPLAASRYRLTGSACAALVLLRVAVGWHFLYEGLWKIDSWRAGTRPFSAEGYLANSSGPLRPWFRSKVDDPDGLKRLEPASVATRWDAIVKELNDRYHLTDEQQKTAGTKIRELQQSKETYFGSAETQQKIEDYRRELAQTAGDTTPGSVRVSAESDGGKLVELGALEFSDDGLRVASGPELPKGKPLRLHLFLPGGREVVVSAEPDPRSSAASGVPLRYTDLNDRLRKAMRFGERSDLSYERERARDKRKELNKTRDELVGPVDAWSASLRETVMRELSADQKKPHREGVPGWLATTFDLPFDLTWPERDIDRINLVTMCGLTLAGVLLVVGLFSRLSALAAAVLIGMFYLCNPAPPLGTGNLGDPGHYLYVNKELVEFLAALVLATIPTGRWLGLDALIRGLLTRRASAALLGTPDDGKVKS